MGEERKESTSVVDSVLIRSRRRCALCFDEGDNGAKVGNVAHIRPVSAGGMDAYDNLVYLCAKHHALLDRSSQGEGLASSVRAARDRLYSAFTPPTTPTRVVVVHGGSASGPAMLNEFFGAIGIETLDLSEYRRNSEVSWGPVDLSSFPIGVVLLSGDEYRTSNGVSMRPVPSTNVLIELGMLLSLLGPDRLYLLHMKGVSLPNGVDNVKSLMVDSAGLWRGILLSELAWAGLLPEHLPALTQRGPTSTGDAPQSHPAKR